VTRDIAAASAWEHPDGKARTLAMACAPNRIHDLPALNGGNMTEQRLVPRLNTCGSDWKKTRARP
jgi:hypothetical protein